VSVTTAAVEFFRQRWAERFAESETTVHIYRAGEPTLNPSTGELTPTIAETVYNGAALVRPQTATDVVSGEIQQELRGYLVLVPYTVAGVKPDYRVAVTTTRDSHLDGRTLVVRNVAADTYNTRRALDCEVSEGG
jgi:hypothetical protein